ncbi:MAG: hypothetical protein DRP47_06105 [Candidatus Zixiibacteriota bacterium]|nr:MAG: hypothetical protein DRP47_06105 [candidate division Zixibacteria bacterium]
MRIVLDFLRLIRVSNGLLTAIGVWVGAYLTWNDPIYYGPMIASLSAFLVCSFGNCVNDMLDMEIDRVNRPDRVLVRGVLSTRIALIVALLCGLGAMIAAVAVNWEVTVTVAVAIMLLVVYNFKLKRVPLAGNIVIAILGGLTFVTGGLAVNPSWTFEFPGPLIPAVFAVLLHLVREILKDVEDIAGDRAVGITTFPQVVGIRSALVTAIGFFVVLVILTMVPVLFGWFGDAYKIIAVYIVDLPLLALLIMVWGNPSPRMLTFGSLGLKVGMALGIIALMVA